MITEARVSPSSRSGSEPGFSNRSVNSTDFDDVDHLPIAWRINQIPSRKTKTLEPEDRISKLPDSILLHILTFLPITDAIRTTLLSKRWVNLWVSIPSLVFRFDQHRFHNVKLVINGYYGRQYMGVKDAHIMSINAPNLRLLDISGHMFHTNCQVENLSSLVEARLSFGWYPLFRYNSRLMEFKTMLTESLERIKHVKKLTLRMFFLQVPELRRNLLYKRKSFGTAHSFRKYCSCLQHLKMVNIIGLVLGCTETEFVIEFLQFLLKHAKVLEKLSIDTSRDDEHTSAKKDSLFEVAKALLRIPRLSPFAEIQLN